MASGCIPEARKDPTIYRKGRKGHNGRRVTLLTKGITTGFRERARVETP
jgi:hypothetical protein